MLAQRLFRTAQRHNGAKVSASVWVHLFRSRGLHTSPAKRALVGPPDPVSNLRPVIYDDIDPSSLPPGRRRKGKGKEGGPESEPERNEKESLSVRQPQTSTSHPYLLDEFSGDPSDYQWRLERQRLDAYNHTFWKDSNTRFETAKQAVLSSLPEDATPEAREAALSEFYGKWLQQEHERLKDYSNEWNRRNFGGIMLAARAAINQFRSRLFGDSKSR